MNEYTREDDAQIAEIIGAKWVERELGGIEHQILEFPGESDNRSNYDYLGHRKHLNNIPSFLTLPTHETDGTCKRWIKDQDYTIRKKVELALRGIWAARAGLANKGYKDNRWIHVILKHEDPGDYAHALLEVVNE